MNVQTPISPKVTYGALAGGLTAVIVALAQVLGFEPAGDVAAAAGVLLGALVTAVAAWSKRDPLRDAGQAATTTTAATTDGPTHPDVLP